MHLVALFIGKLVDGLYSLALSKRKEILGATMFKSLTNKSYNSGMLKRADPKNQPRTALDSYSRHMSRLTLSLTLNARKVNEKLSVSKTNFFHLCDV